MKKQALLSSILFMLVFLSQSLGQSPLPASNLRIFLKVPPNTSQLLREIPPDSISSVLQTLPLECILHISLVDTIGVDSITVNLGTSQGGNQLFTGNFPAHGAGSLTNGVSYIRKGAKLTLKLGTFQGNSIYYAEVRTQNANGAVSGVVQAQSP